MDNHICHELQLKYPPIFVVLSNEPSQEAAEFCGARSNLTCGSCAISALKQVAEGKTVFFSKETAGCPGFKQGFGFVSELSFPGGIEYFLSSGKGPGFPEGEKIKKTPEIARNFFYGLPKNVHDTNYVVFCPLNSPLATKAKLVIFIANPDQLSALITLFLYESSSVDDVYAPLVSGCTSIVKLPLAELNKATPRAVIGLVDTVCRPLLDEDSFAFTVPYSAYLQMEGNSKDCFLQVKTWTNLKARLPNASTAQ